MNRYLTTEDLRRAVERKVGKIVDRDWKKSEPEWKSPYAAGDFEEIEQRYRELKRESAKAKSGNAQKTMQRVGEQALYESEIRALEHSEYVANVRKELFGKGSAPFSDLESMVEWINDEQEAERSTIEIRDVDEDDFLGEFTTLKWPKIARLVCEKDGQIAQTFCNPVGKEWYGALVLQKGKLGRLAQDSKYLSYLLRCNEEQATTYLLLGWIPIVEQIRFKISQFYSPISKRSEIRIKIEVDPSVPNSLVVETYKMAKELVREQRLGEFKKKRSSPSPIHSKIKAFLKRYEGESIEQIRRKWNKANPKHRINDWRSLYRELYR